MPSPCGHRSQGPACYCCKGHRRIERRPVRRGALSQKGLPLITSAWRWPQSRYANKRPCTEAANRLGYVGKDGSARCLSIVVLGRLSGPRHGHLLDAQTQAFEALLTRRRQLVEMLTAEETGEPAPPKFYIAASMSTSAGWKSGWAASTTKLGTLIRDTPIWRERDHLLDPRLKSAPYCRGPCSPTCPTWGTQSQADRRPSGPGAV